MSILDRALEQLDERLGDVAPSEPEPAAPLSAPSLEARLDRQIAEHERIQDSRDDRPAEPDPGGRSWDESEMAMFEQAGVTPAEVAGYLEANPQIASHLNAGLAQNVGLIGRLIEGERAEADAEETARAWEESDQERDQDERDAYHDQVLNAALEQLVEAEETYDEHAPWHLADRVATQAPDKLVEYMQGWYERDPESAARYAAMHDARQERQAQIIGFLEQQAAEAAHLERATQSAQQEAQARTEALIVLQQETETLLDRDPDAERLVVHMSEIGRRSVPPGGFRDAAEAREFVRNTYEKALAFEAAREEVDTFIMPFLENEWRQSDEEGPFDREAARAAEIAKRIRLAQPGAATRVRHQDLAGTRDRSGIFTRGLAYIDERIAQGEAHEAEVERLYSRLAEANARRNAR